MDTFGIGGIYGAAAVHRWQLLDLVFRRSKACSTGYEIGCKIVLMTYPIEFMASRFDLTVENRQAVPIVTLGRLHMGVVILVIVTETQLPCTAVCKTTPHDNGNHRDSVSSRKQP